MKLFKTWCWTEFRMRRAVLTLVSAFISSSVLKAKPHSALWVRLFFQSVESAAKSGDQSLDWCLSHLSHWNVEETFQWLPFCNSWSAFLQGFACCMVRRRLMVLPLWTGLQLLLSIYMSYVDSYRCWSKNIAITGAHIFIVIID